MPTERFYPRLVARGVLVKTLGLCMLATRAVLHGFRKTNISHHLPRKVGGAVVGGTPLVGCLVGGSNDKAV